MKNGLTTVLLVTLATLSAVQAEEFRLLDEVGNVDRGRLAIGDVDNDGKLDLVRSDLITEYDTAMADHGLYLVQIAAIDGHRWQVNQAFVSRSKEQELGLTKAAHVPMTEYTESPRLTGDFNRDGVPDMLIVQSEVPGSENRDTPYLLRLVQEGHTIFQDDLSTCPFCPRPSRFQKIDLDADGVEEIVLWLLDYRNTDRIRIYGSDHSKWTGNNTFDFSPDLGNVLDYVQGVHAAHPESSPQVIATLEQDESNTTAQDDVSAADRGRTFRVTFTEPIPENTTDLTQWRAYFQKFAIGYIQSAAPETTTPRLVRRVHDLNIEIRGDVLAIEVRPHCAGCRIPAGDYTFWLACPYVEPLPNSFGWFGTLRTERLYIRAAESSPAETLKPKETIYSTVRHG